VWEERFESNIKLVICARVFWSKESHGREVDNQWGNGLGHGGRERGLFLMEVVDDHPRGRRKRVGLALRREQA